MQWRPNSDIIIEFQNQNVVTSPTLIVSDEEGEFSATFNVPQIGDGGKEINITDGLNSKQVRFQVTP